MISNIKSGQKVEFTVLAYPDSVFSGVVSQIRMHPRMVQNVVNYIVVINANNKDGMLLPGMTATVDFILSQKKDLLKVSKSALNFKIPEKFLKRMSSSEKEHMEELIQNVKKDEGALWYFNREKVLQVTIVQTGESDDNGIEVTNSGNLKAGDLVICGINETDAEKTQSKSSNQLLNNNSMQSGGSPPPPPGGQ